MAASHSERPLAEGQTDEERLQPAGWQCPVSCCTSLFTCSMAAPRVEHEPLVGEQTNEENSTPQEYTFSPTRDRCCCCIPYRAGAVIACLVVSLTNVLTIAACTYLIIKNNIHNENFYYVLLMTINAIMLISNCLILHGVSTQRQRYVIAWILLYVVLLFLENVIGIAAFVLAVVEHASAWASVPFLMMLVLDGIYIFGIITVRKYCKSLSGYEVIP